MEIAASGNVTIANDLTVSGNLTVSGDTITANVGTLDVEDKNITLNYSTGDSSATANGAGITIQDAVNSTTDATILWDASSDRFEFSNGVDVENGGAVRVYRSGNSAYGELRFDTGENLDLFSSWGNKYLRLTRDGHLQLSGTTRIEHNGDATLGAISSGPILAEGAGTTSSTNALKVTKNGGESTFTVRDDGVVLVQSNYLYVNNNAGFYSTGAIRARGGITNDGGNALSISSGAAHIAFNSKNFASVGTISSGAITTTGDISLNKADGFVYLNNVGTGNSGIYVRGITSSNTLRSHTTDNFRWEVSGSQKMELVLRRTQCGRRV